MRAKQAPPRRVGYIIDIGTGLNSKNAEGVVPLRTRRNWQWKGTHNALENLRPWIRFLGRYQGSDITVYIRFVVETPFKDFNILKVFFYSPITMDGWVVYLVFKLTLKVDGDQPVTGITLWLVCFGRGMGRLLGWKESMCAWGRCCWCSGYIPLLLFISIRTCDLLPDIFSGNRSGWIGRFGVS